MSNNRTISIVHLGNIHRALENYKKFAYGVVAQEIKDLVSDEAYNKIVDLFMKYHNANCGPFNESIKNLIEKGKI